MKSSIIYGIVFVFLSACSPAARDQMAIMKNPRTGETAQCTVNPWQAWAWERSAFIQHCVEGYEKAGFERVD